MNKKIKLTTKIIAGFALVVLTLMASPAVAQKSPDPLDLGKMIQPLNEHNIFRDSLYYNWGGSILKADDGKYHLFYSRWKKKYSFKGWLTFSEIAHAVSDSPLGPWKYKETVLKGRGLDSLTKKRVLENHSWDAITAHNAKIKYFDGKYYLYYISTNFGDEACTFQQFLTATKDLRDYKRGILRKNQRTGVAVSNSLNGPWKRMDTPLIEPSGPIETLTVNPAIAKGKEDSYFLIIKGDKPNVKGFIRNQAIAIGKSPVGPFVMQNKAVIDNLDTEDVSMWYDSSRDSFYAVFHAHTFIGLVTANDGINWRRATNFKITPKKILLEDGSWIRPDRMERPFVYVENGKPKVLLVAIKKGDDSYIACIPLAD